MSAGGIKEGFTIPHMYKSQIHLVSLRSVLLPFWGLVYLGGKSNPDVILLQDIKNRDPILANRFHTDIITVILGKPVTQLLQSFRKGRKADLLIYCAVVGISDIDTGKDPCFVGIKSAAVVF